jgi:hypothetical protein
LINKNKLDEYDMLYGGLILTNEVNINKIIKIDYKKLLSFRPTVIKPITPIHPETITKLNILMKFKFDTTYKFAADLKMMINIIRNHKVLFVDLIIVKMLMGGMSSNSKNFTHSTQELFRLMNELHISIPFHVFVLGALRIKLRKYLNWLKS